MHVWEGITLALNQIRTEKLKSFFSLLGVIIGVMFLLVVVSVVEGMDRYITEDFASQIFGINTVDGNSGSGLGGGAFPTRMRILSGTGSPFRPW